MKSLTQFLALSLLLTLVLAGNIRAEEVSAPEVLPTAVVEALKTEATDVSASSSAEAPLGAATRPAPVFLAGTSAGGAGGAKTGLVNGRSSSAPRTYVGLEDYWCCPTGETDCYCHYWVGKWCNPAPSGCPRKKQPNCS